MQTYQAPSGSKRRAGITVVRRSTEVTGNALAGLNGDSRNELWYKRQHEE